MVNREAEFFDDMPFGIFHKITAKPDMADFPLHNHNDIYEIVLLLDGDCEFCVEGNSYSVHPRGVMFTRPFEMHRMKFLSEKTYERIVLFIRADFFRTYNCEKYLELFENRELGTGNMIPYDAADRSIYDCIKRLCSYGSSGEYAVTEKVIYELLHLMNSYKSTADYFRVKNECVRNIIMYINNNLSNELTLDSLAADFFISKHYMCKVFKANTGYTVNQYINHKRILLAQELHRNGESLIQASLNAGFNNYANFYKTYVKHMGTSPKDMD